MRERRRGQEGNGEPEKPPLFQLESNRGAKGPRPLGCAEGMSGLRRGSRLVARFVGGQGALCRWLPGLDAEAKLMEPAFLVTIYGF